MKVTWLTDFKAAIEDTMKCTYVADPAVFAGMEFRVSDKSINGCKSCKQPASTVNVD